MFEGLEGKDIILWFVLLILIMLIDWRSLYLKSVRSVRNFLRFGMRVASKIPRIWMKIKELVCRSSRDPDKDLLLKNLGVTMAYGHYFYEASFGLKELKQKAKNYNAEQEVTIQNRKKIILISSTTPRIMVEEIGVEEATYLQKDLCDVAGTAGRIFVLPVYKLTSPIYNRTNLRPYYVVESPSSLETLSQIATKCKKFSFTKEEIERLIYQFASWLNLLLKSDDTCNRWFDFYFVDTDSLLNVLEKKVKNINIDAQLSWKFNYEGTGVALAYYFYYNFLARIFTDLETRLIAFDKKKIGFERRRLLYKLFLIIPLNGRTRKILGDDPDEHFIEDVGNLKSHAEYIGLKLREYTSTVYKIKYKGQEDKVLYCLVEYPAPIRQLDNMRKHADCKPFLKRTFLKEEIKNFKNSLEKLLVDHEHDRLCELIDYDDESNVKLLSDVIYEHYERHHVNNRDEVAP